MQVADLLRTFDYVAARPDVDAGHISILGKGNGGVLALYTAALEPRLEKVASEGAITSYMEIVRAKLHQNIADIVIPGVLRDFDLPDLAASIAPRAIWIVDPRNPDGTPAALARAHARPQGTPFLQTYGEWLK